MKEDNEYNSDGFSERLKNVRLYRKFFTQTIICEKLNISRQTWSMWERGKRIPHMYDMVRLANYLNIRVDYFYTKYADPKDYDLSNKKIINKYVYVIELMGDIQWEEGIFPSPQRALEWIVRKEHSYNAKIIIFPVEKVIELTLKNEYEIVAKQINRLLMFDWDGRYSDMEWILKFPDSVFEKVKKNIKVDDCDLKEKLNHFHNDMINYAWELGIRKKPEWWVLKKILK